MSSLESSDELYDLETDPYELANLIDTPEAQETVVEMENELAALLEETAAITE